MAFIFGAGTDTPDAATLARRRQMADQLRMQSVSGTPQNLGQGISAIGQALAARWQDKRLAPMEQAERERLTADLNKYSALLGGAPMGGGGGQYAQPGPNQDIANAAMTAIERPDAASIRQGLIQRGLPEHVADGFLMNFKDESGLDPGINEIAPLVPGSRGGFGLAQWTGPRRRALEAFANERGAAVADPNVQLDFLMTELQGPESRAAQSILSSQDSSAAAQAIARDFLRPAPENLQKRLAQYGGGQSAPMGGGQGAPQGMPQGGTNPQMIQQLAEIAGNPYASEGQKAVAAALMQQQMHAADPMRQMQMETARLQLEQLRNPPAPPPIEVGGVLVDANTLQPVFDSRQPQAGTTDERNYDRYVQGATARGETPMPFERFLTLEAAAGNPGASEVGTIPPGYELFTDPTTNARSLRPIAGGPVAQEIAAQERKTERREEQGQLSLGTTLQSLNLNIADVEDGGLPVTGAIGDFRRTGLGRLLTGDAAVDFGNRSRQITDAAALAEIQQMRDNSPTGGAVGSLTDGERVALGNARTAISESTSGEEYVRAAKAYRELALDTAYGKGKWELREDGTVVPKLDGAESGDDDVPTYNPQTGQWE